MLSRESIDNEMVRQAEKTRKEKLLSAICEDAINQRERKAYEDSLMEDREFELRHNANPPSKEEEVYRSLAGYIHNELPMHEFKRDHIWDDPRIDRLLVETLKHKFTGRRVDLSAIGESWLQIVSEAFRDYVSMQPEDE